MRLVILFTLYILVILVNMADIVIYHVENFLYVIDFFTFLMWRNFST